MEKQDIPPFIGFILSDKDGRKIETIEVFEGAFKKFLDMDEDGSEIELIPMFVSAMEKFSASIHFNDLSNFTLNNSHLKMKIFPFEFFTVALFVEKSIDLEEYSLQVRKFFHRFYKKFHMVFSEFKITGLYKTNEQILSKGKKWLHNLNKNSNFEQKIRVKDIA